MDVRVEGKRSQRGSETLDGAVDIMSFKMNNISDLDRKVFELVVLQKEKYALERRINQSEHDSTMRSILSYLAVEIIFLFFLREEICGCTTCSRRNRNHHQNHDFRAIHSLGFGPRDT
jgi:hypothetical protein